MFCKEKTKNEIKGGKEKENKFLSAFRENREDPARKISQLSIEQIGKVLHFPNHTLDFIC